MFKKILPIFAASAILSLTSATPEDTLTVTPRETPPSGVTAKIGITVEGIFSANGKT